MILYPEVQAKAQSEIDSVVGNARLPCLADRNELPYINALTLEMLRWHTVAPMGNFCSYCSTENMFCTDHSAGVPHRATEDDVFEGYHIPKGALILTNLWNMAHDSKIYHEPMKFMPERFLSTGNSQPEMDPHKYCFGFGRR